MHVSLSYTCTGFSYLDIDLSAFSYTAKRGVQIAGMILGARARAYSHSCRPHWFLFAESVLFFPGNSRKDFVQSFQTIRQHRLVNLEVGMVKGIGFSWNPSEKYAEKSPGFLEIPVGIIPGQKQLVLIFQDKMFPKYLFPGGSGNPGKAGIIGKRKHRRLRIFDLNPGPVRFSISCKTACIFSSKA